MKKNDYDNLVRKTMNFRHEQGLKTGWVIWCDGVIVHWTEDGILRPDCKPGCLAVDGAGRVMRAVRIDERYNSPLADAWISEEVEA